MLTDAARMRRAAELVGKGATRREAAAAVGRCERTVREWLKRPELAAIARTSRHDALEPSVESVLREALSALKRDGSPDHQTRLRAAALLLANADAFPPAQEHTVPKGAIVVYPEALQLLADG